MYNYTVDLILLLDEDNKCFVFSVLNLFGDHRSYTLDLKFTSFRVSLHPYIASV